MNKKLISFILILLTILIGFFAGYFLSEKGNKKILSSVSIEDINIKLTDEEMDDLRKNAETIYSSVNWDSNKSQFTPFKDVNLFSKNLTDIDAFNRDYDHIKEQSELIRDYMIYLSELPNGYVFSKSIVFKFGSFKLKLSY